MPKNTVQIKNFQGYSSPNYTPVPDELFDEQLTILSGAELKVLLYIIRRTFGFKKETDNISLNQLLNGITTREGEILDKGTGLSKKTLLEAIRSLVEQNLILTQRRRSVERGDEPTTYMLNIAAKTTKTDFVPRGVKTTPGGVEKSTPRGSSNNSPTQETGIQETDLQIRNSNVKTERNISERTTGHQKFQAVGELLKSKLKAKEGSDSISYTEIPDPIKAAVQEISTEFGEQRSVRSNITHAARVWKESKKGESSFTSALYEAKSITKQQGSVKKKMPYFFSVLEDITGVNKGRKFAFQTT